MSPAPITCPRLIANDGGVPSENALGHLSCLPPKFVAPLHHRGFRHVLPVESEVSPLNLQKLPMMGLMPMCNQRSPRYDNSTQFFGVKGFSGNGNWQYQRPQLQQLAEAARALMATNSASEERLSTSRI